MTGTLTLYCDYCNPGREKRGDDDRGYAVVGCHETPLGWWEVPGKGADGEVGHACPWCMVDPDGEAWDDVISRRDAATQMIVTRNPPTPDAANFQGAE